MSPASKQALRLFEERFEKEFGEGKLRRGRRAQPYDVVSTGSILLDQALGVGGLVRGRCYENWGPPSAGKTTLAMLMAAEQQKAEKDRMIGWVNVERSFDDDWAVAHGVDMDRTYVTTPQTAEDVADQVKRLIDSHLCSFIVVDSIGAMIAKKELEKDAEEAVVAAVAKIVTRMIKMAAPACDDHGTTLLVVNQVRSNIGGYGADTGPGGGFALAHSSTAQFNTKATGEPPLVTGTGKQRVVVGKTINVQVAKNKVAPPLRSAMITLKNMATAEHGPIGIDLAAEAFQLADRFSLVERAGAWYTLADGSRHNGGDAVRAHFRENPQMIADIRTKALAQIEHTVVTGELKEGATA